MTLALIIIVFIVVAVVGYFLLKKKNWRDLPATRKQISYAKSLGLQFDEATITRGEISDMISDLLGEPRHT